MTKKDLLEPEIDTKANDSTEDAADDKFFEKKTPILEEIRLAVAEYRDITDYSKSDYIIKEDIGWHLIFGDIGRHAINKIN